ncbi:MAG: DUF547 domain-containing protein [Bacteroidetes bacterium]|nr:MAG: DUF547 domain-containing protein [Bacteroidota bacterium]
MKTTLLVLTTALWLLSPACQSPATPNERTNQKEDHAALNPSESMATPPPSKPTDPTPKTDQEKELQPPDSKANKKTTPKTAQPLPETVTLSSDATPPQKTAPVIETPSAPEPTPQTPVLKVPLKRNVPSHAEWDFLLRRFVNTQGRVNYAALKKEEHKLDNYLSILRENPPAPDWSKGEQLAYWINAYNAFTVKLILEHWPVSSITKLHGGKPWDVKWIQLGDKKYSLNQIENEIIRPKFKEPRIHFAVNCAARSCPPLLNQAWTPRNLEPMFERQARRFINDPAFNKIQPDAAQLSKIFDWYAEDFGDLVAFINRYSKVKLRPDAKITFLEYDWALNKQ